jgi:hypothetical protein
MASMKPALKPFLRQIAAQHLFERGQAPFATDRVPGETEVAGDGDREERREADLAPVGGRDRSE